MPEEEKTRVWTPPPDDSSESRQDSPESERPTEPYQEEEQKTQWTKKQTRAQNLAWIVVFKGKKNLGKFDLEADDYLIGRADYCDIRLSDPDQELSRLHGRIRFDDGSQQFTYYDCGSANGSLLNGEEVSRKELKDNDKLTIGPYDLVFKRL